MCTPPYTLILCVKSSVLYTCGSSVEDREGRLTAGGRVDSSQKFSSNASRCVITSSVRNSCSLPGCRYLFLYMRAAWRSLSTMKQRQSSFWGSRRAPAAYKPPLPPLTLRTTPTYGLIPFQNTSNQTNNVWQRISKQSNDGWEPLYRITNQSRRNLFGSW